MGERSASTYLWNKRGETRKSGKKEDGFWTEEWNLTDMVGYTFKGGSEAYSFFILTLISTSKTLTVLLFLFLFFFLGLHLCKCKFLFIIKAKAVFFPPIKLLLTSGNMHIPFAFIEEKRKSNDKIYY